MSSKALSTGLILALVLLFSGLNIQLLAYNQPSYYNQYNFRYGSYNSYYNYNPAYATYPQFSYVTRHWGPQLMPSRTCNALLGCRTTYNSYIYVHDALDYTYYTQPGLLAPRYMNNHERYVWRGLSQAFYYPTVMY